MHAPGPETMYPQESRNQCAASAEQALMPLQGDNCLFAHGVYECWLHPAKYRTQLCKDAPAGGGNCSREVCFFAHTPTQVRRPHLSTAKAEVQTLHTFLCPAAPAHLIGKCLQNETSLLQTWLMGTISTHISHEHASWSPLDSHVALSCAQANVMLDSIALCPAFSNYPPLLLMSVLAHDTEAMLHVHRYCPSSKNFQLQASSWALAH